MKVLKNILSIILSIVITFLFFEITNWYHLGDELTSFITFRLLTFFILLSLIFIVLINKLVKTSLIIGLIPFIFTLFVGIYFAITGFSGLCFCGNFYGFKAFIESIILYSENFYQNYILGFILIIIFIVKTINKKS